MDPWTALRRRIREDGSRPLITFYDDVRGERMELSVTSFGNAVAKAANAIGERAATEVEVRLPLHWQLLVWTAAGMAAGAEVTLFDAPLAGRQGAPPTEAPPTEARVTIDGEVLAVSLHPFALPFPGPLPAGVEDATLVTRVQPDDLVHPPLSGTVAMASGSPAAAWSDLESLCAARAERTLFTQFPADHAALAAMLAAPLVRGGSIVLVRDADSRHDHARDEAATMLWPIV